MTVNVFPHHDRLVDVDAEDDNQSHQADEV